MKRRSFLAGMFTTAAGLLLPYEPKTIYSFPSEAYLNRVLVQVDSFKWYDHGRQLKFFARVKDRHGVRLETVSMTAGKWASMQADNKQAGGAWDDVKDFIKLHAEIAHA